MRGKFKTMIWICVVLLATTFGVYYLVLNFLDFWNAGTISTIHSNTGPLSEIVFPSISICNINKVRRSFLLQGKMQDLDGSGKFNRERLFNTFIDGRDDPLNDTQKATWNDKLKIIQNLTNWDAKTTSLQEAAVQNCKDLFLQVRWQENDNDTINFPDNRPQTGFNDYGVCCNIYPQLLFYLNGTRNKNGDDYTVDDFARAARTQGCKPGLDNGLSMMLDIESFDYAYYPRGAKGAMVTLFSPDDRAVVTQNGFYASTGTESLIALVMKKHTTSDDARDTWKTDPEKRGCYTDDEFQPIYFNKSSGFRYSIDNCLYASMIEEVLTTLKCKPVFLSGTGTLKKMTSQFESCRGFNLTRIQVIQKRFGDADFGLNEVMNLVPQFNKKMPCIQSCTVQKEAMFSTSTHYPSDNVLPIRKDFCLIVNKIKSVCKDQYKKTTLEEKYGGDYCDKFKKTDAACTEQLEYVDAFNRSRGIEFKKAVAKYAKDNIIVLRIFIKDPYFTHTIRDRKLTFLNFVSNAGGLLGLFMGLSLVSIFELFYHIGHAFVDFYCGNKIEDVGTARHTSEIQVRPENAFQSH